MVTSRGQLAAKGLDVVLASRQLGHANPNVTLEACAHLCARAHHAASVRDGSKRAMREWRLPAESRPGSQAATAEGPLAGPLVFLRVAVGRLLMARGSSSLLPLCSPF